MAENKGASIRIFDAIDFRVFAFLEGTIPALYQSKDGLDRLAMTEQARTSTKHFRFSVEPGIRQIFPLTTLISAQAKYVSVKVDVWKGNDDDPGAGWMGEERFFPVILEPVDETRRELLR